MAEGSEGKYSQKVIMGNEWTVIIIILFYKYGIWGLQWLDLAWDHKLLMGEVDFYHMFANAKSRTISRALCRSSNDSMNVQI